MSPLGSSGFSPELAIGKVVAITNRPGPVFVVTDITYDVLGRSYVAHLRQVSPYADVNQRPVPLSDLSESTAFVGHHYLSNARTTGRWY